MAHAMTSISPTRVLLTGANGFVGRAVGSALAKSGHTVRAAVRNVADKLNVNTDTVSVGDINGDTDWSQALLGVDVIIHLAARVHVMHERASAPLAAFRAVNVDGTLNLARQADHAGVKRLVFLSSIKVNGESSIGKQAFSEHDQARPQDDYGISKWEAEQGLHRIAVANSMGVTIVRPPLVYGPGVKGNFATLINFVRMGWPLPLTSIDNQRSLIAIDNLVDFIITCTHHPSAVNETFLVSDGEDMSTPELIRRLAKVSGKTPRLFPIPLTALQGLAVIAKKRNVMQRLCSDLKIDNYKAHNLLGWQPPITVDEGLRRAVASYGS